MSTQQRIGILIGPKGRGSNMRAILEACRDGRLRADAVVITPVMGTPAVEWASDHGCPVLCVPPSENYATELLNALSGCTLVCLAGYLRLLPMQVIDAFPHAVLNIHPALLPKFGGKGMYGMHVHVAVIAARETESGCTVHYVTERYDEGAIVLQARCPVLPDDSPETLASRVLELEHKTYVAAIQRHWDNEATDVS